MTPLNSTRFASVCRMLSSPNAGERANAALAATEMLTKSQLTWDKIASLAADITPNPGATAIAPRPQKLRRETVRYGWNASDLLEAIIAKNVYRSASDTMVIANLASQPKPIALTVGQWSVVAGIARHANITLTDA